MSLSDRLKRLEEQLADKCAADDRAHSASRMPDTFVGFCRAVLSGEFDLLTVPHPMRVEYVTHLVAFGGLFGDAVLDRDAPFERTDFERGRLAELTDDELRVLRAFAYRIHPARNKEPNR